MVYPSKALPADVALYYDKAMLTTSEKLARKLIFAMGKAKLTGVEVAAACGVTKQAVQGWKKTGRIDKKHLPALSEATQLPLSWWLELDDETKDGDRPLELAARERRPNYGTPSWPFKAVSPQDYGQLSSAQQHLVEGFIKGLLSENGSVKRRAAS